GSSNFGIVMTQGGTVESSGSGANAATLTLNGTGGNGSGSSNHGFFLRDAASGIRSADGAVALTGFAQGGGNGIHFAGSFGVETTGTAPITLMATGAGSSADVVADAPAPHTANSLGGPSASGDITIHADTIDWGATRMTLQSSGNLLIQPRTPSASIGLGDGAAGTLNLTAAELDGIQDGFASITIGHASGSGAMDVRSYAFQDDVTLRTPAIGGVIQLNGDLSTGSGALAGDITLLAGQSILGVSAASVLTSSGDITLNAAGLGTGAISGIVLDGSTLRTTGTGNLSLTGTGGGIGSNLYGIHVHNDATVEAQDSGSVTLTGTGSAVGSGTNIGVRVETVGTPVS